MEDERSLSWRSQLQSQYGVISRQQAHDAGLQEKTIDRRLRSGTWQRLHRGAYATFTGDLSREAQLWAAVLRVGLGAVLSHETAAEVHGLIDKPIGQIHISVPATRRPARRKIRGVVIHRSRCLVPQLQPPWQLPRTTVEDTVLDLIATARSFDDAYGWISAAVGRRLTTPNCSARRSRARSRMRWRAWVTGALQDAADGVHSPLERHYVHGVERAHGLPAARRQARRRHGSGNRYLDNLYEEYGLCVELDGARGPPGRRPLARHPPRQRQPRAGNGDAEIRLARRHRAPLPDRRGNRRGPAPPRLDRNRPPLRPRLHRRPGSST